MSDTRASSDMSSSSLSSGQTASSGKKETSSSLCIIAKDYFVPFLGFRYANNSNYKNDTMIRKEAYSHQVATQQHFSSIKLKKITLTGCDG